jgi:PAS domain S-box-containing protein
MPVSVNVLVIGFGLFALFCFAESRRGRNHAKVLVSALILALSLAWFLDGGMDGSVNFYLFSLVVLPMVLFEGHLRWIFAAVILVDFCALNLAGYHYPKLVTPFPFRAEQLLDVISGLVASGLIIVTVIWVVLTSYDREQNRLAQLARDLAASGEKFSKAFRANPNGMAITELETARILEVNAAFCRLHGYAPAELIGRTSLEMGAWESAAERDGVLRPLLTGGAVHEVELRKSARNGETKVILYSAELVELDGKHCVLSMIQDITQRRQAEETLRESEQKFSKMFHSSPLPMALSTSKEGRYLDANLEFLKLLQRSREEVIGRTSVELKVWRDLKQRAAILADVSNEETVRNIALQIRRPSGQIREVIWSAVPMDVGGERCWLGSSLDVTERKRADELLRQERELYLDLVNNQPAGIYRIRVIPIDQHRPDAWTNSAHAHYCFELTSDRFCEILGVERAAFASRPGAFIELIHPDDKERFARQNEAAGNSQLPFRWEGRLVIAGKITWVHIESRPRPAANGDMIWTGILYDITDQKQAEDQTRLQSTALSAAANAIVITDRKGTIEWVNPAFTQLTGYGPEETIGCNPRILKSSHHPPEFYTRLWTTITAGNMWHGEMVNQRKDGRTIIEDTTITPVRDSNGAIAHFVAIKQDITHARQLEAQLRQSQKMEAIGQLAGGVAHDFNNILASLIMQADLLEMADFLPAEVTTGLQQIRADAMRAAQLTRQLLLFSRRQVMQSSQLDLNEVVTNLAKMLQRIIGEDVRLQLNLHPVPLLICADAGMVEQVLLNLAVNARDAMPLGGRVGIESAEKIVTEDLLGLYPDARPGRYVCFSVSDTGTGIPPEILPQIFEPFFTTKEAGKGTGLGLATVFGIVKQHQGWLKVDNQPGQGATFRIFLPASTVTPDEAVQTEVKPKPRGGHETILLVEDEASVRKTIRSLLERRGYQVVVATNGIEALDLWPTHSGKVALVLTDLVMPGGMTGYELARQLQSGQPNLKTIYLSGYSAEIAGRRIELRPGEIFIQKPCAAAQLLEAIRGSLEG